ncbi:MAG: hypothetical protein EOO90_03315 [Pedobacter sp.]|nr:MAG: hypothetical protein EOO90_03315 [Pedobacter sp.]
MNKIILILTVLMASFVAKAQEPTKKAKAATTLKNQTVEIACGECKFKMKGKSCDLAIRLEGNSYFVDGKSIDDFGDAHDKDHGFCNVIKKAEVTGEIVKGRFKAKTINLVDEYNKPKVN